MTAAILGFFKLVFARKVLRFFDISIPDDIQGSMGLKSLFTFEVLTGKNALKRVSKVDKKLLVAS